MGRGKLWRRTFERSALGDDNASVQRLAPGAAGRPVPRVGRGEIRRSQLPGGGSPERRGGSRRRTQKGPEPDAPLRGGCSGQYAPGAGQTGGALSARVRSAHHRGSWIEWQDDHEGTAGDGAAATVRDALERSQLQQRRRRAADVIEAGQDAPGRRAGSGDQPSG